MKDLKYFFSISWLTCPDYCINIVSILFMIIIGAFFSSSFVGTIALLILGMTGIIINMYFIKEKLNLK